MRRNIKKLLCVMMIMIMAVSVMACGSKSSKSGAEKLSAEEIYAKMSEAAKDIEGLSCKVNFDVLVSLAGTEMPITGNVEMKAVAEPVQTYMKMDFKMSVLGQEQSMAYEMYEVTSDDGNSVEIYMNEDGEWTYDSAELDESNQITENIKEVMSSVDYSKVAEYFDKIDTKVSGSNYVINMKASSSKIIDKIKETVYGSYLEDADLSEIPEIEITAKVTVDSETFLPKDMTISVGSVEIENAYEGMSVELKKCELTYTYDSYGKVDIVVPEEALAAK